MIANKILINRLKSMSINSAENDILRLVSSQCHIGT